VLTSAECVYRLIDTKSGARGSLRSQNFYFQLDGQAERVRAVAVYAGTNFKSLVIQKKGAVGEAPDNWAFLILEHNIGTANGFLGIWPVNGADFSDVFQYSFGYDFSIVGTPRLYDICRIADRTEDDVSYKSNCSFNAGGLGGPELVWVSEGADHFLHTAQANSPGARLVIVGIHVAMKQPLDAKGRPVTHGLTFNRDEAYGYSIKAVVFHDAYRDLHQFEQTWPDQITNPEIFCRNFGADTPCPIDSLVPAPL
jgi:hypothetical protein